MSTGKVAVVQSSAVGVTGGIGLATAATALGVVGVVAVGIWAYNKKKDMEAFEYNQKILKKDFDSMLYEVKNLEKNILEKFAVQVNFGDKLSLKAKESFRKYDKSLIKDEKHNKKYQEIVQEFSQEAKMAIFKLKELESETLEVMDSEIESIYRFAEKNRESEEFFQKLEELKRDFAKPNGVEQKRYLVSLMSDEVENLKKKEKQDEINEGVSEIVKGVNEQSVKIIRPRQRVINSIAEFKEKIKKYDNNYIKFKNFNLCNRDRLKMILDSVKLDYGKAKELYIWTKIYKENLIKLTRLELGDVIKKEISLLLNSERIHKEQFESVAYQVNKIIIQKQQQAVIIENLKKNLHSLGYGIVDEIEILDEKLENGEVVYLETDDKDYKIMLKLNKNLGITTRVVRMVATQEEKETISSYQRQKDIESAKKWCTNYDKLTNLLAKNGIILNTKLRLEAEDEDIVYIVDKTLAFQSQKKGSKQDNIPLYNKEN